MHPLFSQTETLTVTGRANEKQILASLKRYIHRPAYIQKALYHLFNLTQGYAQPREDVIRLVLRVAKQWPTVFSIQIAITACLYNLCHGVTNRLHPHVLRDIVNADLDAMETFPTHQQLQKNILLVICSDRIINEINFDKFRCAKLALKCLNEWPDNNMNKMCVAICSMLGKCSNYYRFFRLTGFLGLKRVARHKTLICASKHFLKEAKKYVYEK